MKKVWEENWRAEEDPAIEAWDIVEDDEDATMLAHRGSFLTSDDKGYDEARARLAAAAPDMARLILDLMTNYQGSDGSCIGCDAYPETMPHDKKCRVGAVLHKAGIV